MKRTTFISTLAVVLLGLLMVLPAAAQNRRGDRGPRANPEQRVERQLRFLDRNLDLTDAQMDQLRQLWTTHHEAGRAWHEANPEATLEERRQFMEAHQEQLKSTLTGVLTAEQLETFNERSGFGRRMGPGASGLRGPRGGAGAFRGLELSEEQRAQVQELTEQHREAGRAWHEANPEATREERQAFAEAHREQLKSALAGILTPEQLEAFDERGGRGKGMRSERRGGRGGGGAFRGLELSEEQRAQVQEIVKQQREAGRAWHEANPEATREERQAFGGAHREQLKSALAGILTPEQLEAFDERGGRGKGVRSGRRGGGGALRGLELTEQQRARVQELMEQQREAGRAWHEANPEATREERRQFMEAHRDQLRAALEGILTPEQLQTLNEREARNRERMERRRERREQRGQQGGETGAVQGATVDAERDGVTPKKAFGLSNYPNPFNPTTEIRFELPEAAMVSLAVFDLQGREVARLLEGGLSAGAHTATFEAANLPTGTYLYRLTVDGAAETGTMLLTK